MTSYLRFHRRPRRRVLPAVACAAGLIIGACNTDRILDVPTPDIIDPNSVNSAPGAEAVRIGALGRLNVATSGGESFFLYGGLLADEWQSSDTFQQRDETDQRAVQLQNANITTAYRGMQQARVSAQQAAIALKQYKPVPAWETAEMYWVQGYMENLAAENLCNGIPFSFPKTDGTTDFGDPLSNIQAYARALAHADSALATATGTSSDDIRVRNLAKILRGRILLNLGQFPQALAAVSFPGADSIPVTFAYFAEHSTAAAARNNQIWSLNNSVGRYTVANNDGTNGLNFRTAGDPRVQVGASTGLGFDSRTPLFPQLLYGQTSSFPIVTGIEAKLIIAEALLKAGNATWLDTLNKLRASPKPSWIPAPTGGYSLAPLALPATQTAKEDLVFRERAFWLFLSGHRLGDLRRLVRQYSRPAESVYPTGTFLKGGTHGADLNFPVVQSEENNPKFHGCTDRAA
ncbi:MAG: hypothetical protein M3081_22090 [Gemmatimonadota bacterium]|nr:hypothetical protein [Gemmatimonadota bacterium]